MNSEQQAVVERLTGERRKMILPVEPFLERVGFQKGGHIADIGCGVGYLSLPLAARAKSVVAIDVSQDMLDILRERADEAGVTNIETVNSGEYDIVIATGSADGALISMVLHEVDRPKLLLAEAARVTKPGGLLAAVEWKKEEQRMGPPIAERLSQAQIAQWMTDAGFVDLDSFEISEFTYGVVGTRVG